MSPQHLFKRYCELQAYVGWIDADAQRVRAAADLIEPRFPALIDDFYAEIERHPQALRVITGGHEQIERLKGTLRGWLRELFTGKYDSDYVGRRWRVGWRHVEIGLDQIYTNAALSRLRVRLTQALQEAWPGEPAGLRETVRSLNKLLDLDLAVIQEAYQAESNVRLQRIERLATMGQVAGGVAHELRNPLNVVKTSVYYLLNARSVSSEKAREHLERIERHVNLADGVMTTLSNFARMPLPSLKPFPVEPCVRQVLELTPLPAAIRISIECPPDLPQVLADEDQIRIVLANLIRNARDAMLQGGDLLIAGRRAGQGVEIEVRDTGMGIKPEHMARIMEPLFSTKARGLGLGLALARSILEKNNGGIHVASEPGRGTSFTVQLETA